MKVSRSTTTPVVRFVDALWYVVQRLLAKPDPDSPLWVGPGVFAERSDIRAVTEGIRDTSESGRFPVLLDLSFVRALGDTARLQPILDIRRKSPFAVVVREGLASRATDVIKQVPHIVLGESLSVISIELGGLPAEHEEALSGLLRPGSDWIPVREGLVERRIASLAASAIEETPVTQRYITLPDGTAANKWLASKRLLTNATVAVEWATEIALRLTKYLAIERPDATAFVAGNNCGYLLMSYVQRLLPSIPVFMIDRLGPYPHLSDLRVGALQRLFGHKVCVIADVVSTGRELDLMHSYLRHADASILQAVSVFDLEVARPLAATCEITALCRASRFLDYVRIPRYSTEAAHRA